MSSAFFYLFFYLSFREKKGKAKENLQGYEVKKVGFLIIILKSPCREGKYVSA